MNTSALMNSSQTTFSHYNIPLDYYCTQSTVSNVTCHRPFFCQLVNDCVVTGWGKDAFSATYFNSQLKKVQIIIVFILSKN